jgi:small subunit ribosomal protein S4
LRAKQRARRIYGVTERPFRRFFGMAIRRRGPTGLNLLHLLETRLDNVVYRLGWASSRPQARQLVNHGHFLVNGHRADIPSMILKPGDVIALTPTARDLTYFKELPDLAGARVSATWLDRDLENMVGRVLRYPERSEIEGAINEQLIVEYYSR